MKRFAKSIADGKAMHRFASAAIRMLFAIVAILPIAAAAVPATQLYIQQGLVAAYDGINNADTGKHVSSTTGGAVSLNGAAAAASISKSIESGVSETLLAVPDRDGGYVFERWTGDTSAITSGSILTPEITVASDRAVSLTAKFRRNGDALDGLKFDISFAGDRATDGITFSPSYAPEGSLQHYTVGDVALPIYPTVTNESVNCVYLPQPSDTSAKTVFRQDWRKSGVAVTGEVATIYCRFRWDGSVLPDVVNYPAVIMNGYESWSAYPNQGFCVRLRVEKNATSGYFTLIVPNLVVGYNDSGITSEGAAYINAGRWVDVFASVYPSPTNPSLSNADIWYCEVPSWNANGYFNASTPGHRHFGDGCKIPRMNTTTRRYLTCGSEPNASEAAITEGNGVKAFRGAYAAAKGWDRILSEAERWTVMRGIAGVQSFDDLETPAARTFTTCYLDIEPFTQGRNGTATSFLGAGMEDSIRWRAMTTSWNSNTLIYNAPKDTDPLPVVYSTRIRNSKAGNTHEIHLEANGVQVWPEEGSATVKNGDEIRVNIGAEYTYPGLNTLRWVYDTKTENNWIIFDHHKLRIVPPTMPMVLIIR